MRKWRNCTFKYSARIFGLHVDFAGCPQCGVHPAQKKSELRAHQMARKFEVPGSPRTKIRAELSPNGSDVRPAGLTPRKRSTPRSYGMGIVFCISNCAHRLPPRCPGQSPHSTAPLFRFSAPFAFLREQRGFDWRIYLVLLLRLQMWISTVSSGSVRM